MSAERTFWTRGSGSRWTPSLRGERRFGQLVGIDQRPAELRVRSEVLLPASLHSSSIVSRHVAVRSTTLSVASVEDDPYVAPVLELSTELVVPTQPRARDDKNQHLNGSPSAASRSRPVGLVRRNSEPVWRPTAARAVGAEGARRPARVRSCRRDRLAVDRIAKTADLRPAPSPAWVARRLVRRPGGTGWSSQSRGCARARRSERVANEPWTKALAGKLMATRPGCHGPP